MPKLSICIPTYTLSPELERLALWCAASYKDQCDELIICEDGGMFSPKLMEIADTYIYNRDNGGFSVNYNRAWRYATGDFVMLANSDTQLVSGNLLDLCIPGKVTSPIIENQEIPFLAGPFWCAPKEVTKQRGYLLEELHTYCSDSDYDHRVRDIFQKVDSVKIYHHQAQTVKVAGVEGQEQQARDNAIYHQLIAEGKASG